MPPVFGPWSASFRRLWSWRGGQRQHVLAVAHDDEAGFFAGQEFLDHDARAGVAEAVIRQHVVDRLVRFFQRHGDHHALAGRQAVGLDDDRRAVGVDVGVGLGGVGEGLVLRGRDAVALHEGLGEVLRAFQLRRFAGRAEDLQAARAEQVDDAGRQRRSGADQGQGDVFGHHEVGQRGRVRDVDVDQARIARGAAVARRDIDHLDAVGLGQFPGQGVFTAARADYQDFHGAYSSMTALV
jgi:hypothetical protein